MVFLQQVEVRRKHWPWRGSGFPAGLRKGASIDRGPTDRATRSYTVLGWINTVGCAAAPDPELHGHVADNVSRSRAHHRSGGESVKVKQEGSGCGCSGRRARAEERGW